MLLISIVKYLSLYVDSPNNHLSDEQQDKLLEAQKIISQVINELDTEGYYDN